jgi:anti-anti-sigma factor
MLGRFRRRGQRHHEREGNSDLARRSPAGKAAERLRLEVSEAAHPARLALHGQFDIASADDARRALEELLSRGFAAVVVDLSGLDFIDSTGIRFLVDGRDTALARDVKLSLVHGGDPVLRVLEVSGVTALFDGADNEL